MPDIMLLGDWDRSEFAPVSQALAAIDPAPSVRRRHTAEDRVTPESYADLWIVCQSWSDQFSADQIRELIHCCGTDRLLCVYGAWCASDGRTRILWPAAARVPIAGFSSRLRYELSVIRGERPPLPLTAARDELFAATCPQRAAIGAHS